MHAHSRGRRAETHPPFFRGLACILAAAALQGCAADPSADAPAPPGIQAAPGAGDAEPANFDAIRAQSRRDSRAPAAVQWEREHVREGGSRLTPIFNACGESAAAGQDQSFTLLVRLSKEGRPTQLLVSPESPFADCFRDGVARLRFPGAPWEGYWLEVAVRQ